jgi:hypothetical protein
MHHDAERAGRVRRAWLVGLVVMLIALIMGALLSEGAIRLYAAFDHNFALGLKEFDPFAVELEPHGRHGYKQRPNARFHYENGSVATSNALGYRGPVVPETPAPGTTRIILFGGSTTHGWGVSDSATLDAHMRAILHERFPDRQFEVVNLGFDGYDSFQLLERLQSDGLRMRPTVIVINEGNNDVRNAQFANLRDEDPRTLIWENVVSRLRTERERGGPTLWTRAKHYSYAARAPGYVRQQLERKRELAARRSVPAQKNPAAAATDSGPPFISAADYFEKNIRKMVALAEAQGVKVLLSTPPSSLRWLPDTTRSTQSYWTGTARMTQQYRDELAKRLQMIAHDEQERGEAVRYVRPQIDSFPLFLDDCHLKSEGNRIEAGIFVDAIMPMLEQPGRPAATTGTSTRKG